MHWRTYDRFTEAAELFDLASIFSSARFARLAGITEDEVEETLQIARKLGKAGHRRRAFGYKKRWGP